jgi:hypothetical protein
MDSFAEIEIVPKRGVDVGKRRGKRLQTRVIDGAMGILIDARGRPLHMQDTKQQIGAWMKALEVDPNNTSSRSTGAK